MTDHQGGCVAASSCDSLHGGAPSVGDQSRGCVRRGEWASAKSASPAVNLQQEMSDRVFDGLAVKRGQRRADGPAHARTALEARHDMDTA